MREEQPGALDKKGAFWWIFHPFLQRSGFKNHYQLVGILSYFETNDLGRDAIAGVKIYFPPLGLHYRDPICKVEVRGKIFSWWLHATSTSGKLPICHNWPTQIGQCHAISNTPSRTYVPLPEFHGAFCLAPLQVALVTCKSAIFASHASPPEVQALWNLALVTQGGEKDVHRKRETWDAKEEGKTWSKSLRSQEG